MEIPGLLGQNGDQQIGLMLATHMDDLAPHISQILMPRINTWFWVIIDIRALNHETQGFACCKSCAGWPDFDIDQSDFTGR